MKDIIETLERYFNTVKEAQGVREFVFGLMDYVCFIQETPDLLGIVQEFSKEKETLLKKMEEKENKSIEELKKSKMGLLGIIKKNKLAFPKLVEILKEFNEYEVGQRAVSDKKSNAIEKYLIRISKVIIENDKGNLIKRFVWGNENDKWLCFSRTLTERRELGACFNNLRENEIWGHWDYMKCIFELATNRKSGDIFSEREQIMSSAFFRIEKELHFSNREIARISNGLFAQPTEVNLKIQKYQYYITRINNHLLKELGKTKSQDNGEKKEIIFDNEKSILNINGTPIKIQKFSNQYYLLDLILQNKENEAQDWQFSEIAETVECLEGFSDKKLYNIANAIKHKVAEKTSIDDFFITTSQSVKINEKYLKI